MTIVCSLHSSGQVQMGAFSIGGAVIRAFLGILVGIIYEYLNCSWRELIEGAGLL